MDPEQEFSPTEVIEHGGRGSAAARRLAGTIAALALAAFVLTRPGGLTVDRPEPVVPVSPATLSDRVQAGSGYAPGGSIYDEQIPLAARTVIGCDQPVPPARRCR